MRQPLAPKATFDEAIALINAGNLAGADAHCRAALQTYPRDVNMLALLGALLIKMNRAEEAATTLRQAIALAPTFAKPHEDLGRLLVQQNRMQEALPYLERATRLDPNLEDAWFALGKALAALGRGAEADVAFEKCFALSPERRFMALAAEHQKEGRLDEAEHLYRRVLRHNPRNVDAMRLLALIALQAGNDNQAESLLQKALSLAPDFLAAILDLGRLRKEQDRYAEALECFDRAIALDATNAQAHYLRGSTLAPAAFTHEAIEAYERCVELRPDHIGALMGLGHVLKAVGRYHDAVASYDACIRLRPDLGETYWSLANLKTYRFEDATVARMERQIAAGGIDGAVRGELSVCARQGVRGSRRFRQGVAFLSRRQYQAARRGVLRPGADGSHQRPAGAGLLRGVSAVTHRRRQSGPGADFHPGLAALRLDAAGADPRQSQRGGGHERAAVPGRGSRPGSIAIVPRASTIPRRCASCAQRTSPGSARTTWAMRRCIAAQGAPRFIDKMPNNFPSIGLLALILPNARIIDARRHPLDACLSCYRQLFAKGQAFTYDLTEIGEYYLQYQRMMDHWAQVLPGRVLTVQYEEVVADFETQARRLLEFCGLRWEEACLRFYESDRPVRTPSSEQVRQPIYDRSVGHWQHYAAHLDELTTVIAPISRAIPPVRARGRGLRFGASLGERSRK